MLRAPRTTMSHYISALTREGIVLAKERGAYRGRKPTLSLAQQTVVRQRVAQGEAKARIVRELGISRQTLYHYLQMSQEDMIHPNADISSACTLLD